MRSSALLTVVLLAVAGCDLSVEAREDSTESTAASTPSSETATAPTATEPADTPSAAGSSPPTPTATTDAGTSLELTTSGDFDCAGRDVVVDAGALTVTLTGTCRRVEISGDAGVFEIGGARELVIGGLGNVVKIDEVESIELTGDGNVITWTTSPGGEPTVVDSAVGNLVQRGE